MNEHHHLYVIAPTADGLPVAPCKIGISNNVVGRIASIQTGNPRKLSLVAAISIADRTIIKTLESALHEHYADRRLEGEWFDTSPVDAVMCACLMMHDYFIDLGFSESKTLEMLNRMGITQIMKDSIEYVDRCIADGVALQTAFQSLQSPVLH